jgi:hypothetical protein
MSDNMNDICNEIIPLLQDDVHARNTITLSEFLRFIPLFKKAGVQQVGEEEYKRLSEEWMQRISLYDKVTVVSNMSQSGIVILELPPIFTQVSEINVIGEEVARIADYFADVLTRDTRFNGERGQALDFMTKAVNAAQLKSIQSKAEGIREYINIRSKIERRDDVVATVDSAKKNPENTNDFVWE